MSKMADWQARLRQAIGEQAYLERMARLRSKRKTFGGAFRLDYVDSEGRSGSELAAAAGRRSRRN